MTETDERLAQIREGIKSLRYDNKPIEISLGDVKWLLLEVEKLRAENKRLKFCSFPGCNIELTTGLCCVHDNDE